MLLKIRLLIFLLIGPVFFCQGQELLHVELLEDNILLLDARVQQHHVGSSIEAYQYNDRILIAIEPLLDGLKVKYQIISEQLKIWKDSEEIVFNLNSAPYEASAPNLTLEQPLGIWADDGFYQFIELALLAEIFEVRFKTDLSTQMLNIYTGKDTHFYQKKLKSLDEADGYLFPIQKIAILNEQRRSDRYSTSLTRQEVQNQVITIKDQYRLATPPHGRVSIAADLDDKKFNGSVQLVSDLLYHSTNLTMSKSNETDFAARLTLNRYKESPEDRILGLFDYYSVGDVSGVANNLTTSAEGGVGVVFNRRPENFRRKNLETTIDELAPPNWDAELFHNRRFISKTEVPGDGRLLYENVEIFYGLNTFEIKLYGPYGEEEVITRTITVKQNPLAKGQIAYSINALDNNHNLINDRSSSDSFKITNYGGSINYGVTDRWQIGASFASIENDQQLFSIKNNFSFNNFLLENDLSFDQQGNYAQLTTVTGSLFEGDNYSVRFESAENYNSEIVNARNIDFSQYSLAYSLPADWIFANFIADYYTDDFTKNRSIKNTLSKNIGGLSLSHTLIYGDFESAFLNTEEANFDYVNGSLGVSGHYNGFSLTGRLNYDPRADDPILESSSLTLRKRINDPFENSHYIQATYFPLNDQENSWQIRHNVSTRSEDYQLTFSSGYNSNDEWDVQFGIQFFLGYDYHHNKFIMDKALTAGSATLDVHSYLDRQANGIPDVLDYELPEVTFTGNPRWEGLKSSEDGRIILPGVTANGPFTFAAKWQEGSATLNTDYVVYTHPGAYVDVNMPFFLITDLAGFVVRQQQGSEIGLKNVVMQLLNNNNEVLKTVETDEDGYFEFLQLMPDSYKVVISPEYLAQKGLTGETTGTNIATSGRGGFVELPVFVLRRKNHNEDYDTQDYSTFIIDEDNVDALVWSKDEEVNKNYFTLPPKGKVNAEHSLTQSTIEPTKSNDLKSKERVEGFEEKNAPKIAKQIQGTDNPDVFTISSVLEKIEGSTTVLPRIKIKGFESATEVKEIQVEKAPTDVISSEQSEWIIQFMSYELPINKEVALRNFSAIGELFFGQKKSDKNTLLNCVVSRAFPSKEDASRALKKAGLHGWVTNNKVYTNITPIN